MEYENLTKVQNYYLRYKRLPTYKKMQQLFGYHSPSAVSYLVYKWVDQGIVEQTQDSKLTPSNNFFSLPLLGSIKAGYPASSEEYEYESVSLDQYLVTTPGYSYLLRVSGDSMIGAGINEGDLVVIDKKRVPKNGDIIAALIDNEWTLKHYYKEGNSVYLKAANPKYQPIFPQETLINGGVVVSVIRKYY